VITSKKENGMKQFTGIIMMFLLVMFSGCVAKSDYTKKLTEIDGLQKEKAGLEDQNRAKDKDIAGLKQQVGDLTKQKEQLEKENANIKSTLELSRSQLSKEVVALKNKLDENIAKIKVLEGELAAKNKEMDQLAQEKERAIAQVKGTYDSLVTELKQEIKQGEIQITQLKDKLTVNMVDKILFDSGSAVIKKNGEKVLDRVAEILKVITKQQIKVEGHTDNVPISTRLAERFPSNWELSTARATTVVRYLQGRGVNPGVLSAEGYAEYRPVSPNDTDEGKSANRRIEIVLIPQEASK
jgi:chemotaxis protein MotB